VRGPGTNRAASATTTSRKGRNLRMGYIVYFTTQRRLRACHKLN
jgi:hypothetical protein